MEITTSSSNRPLIRLDVPVRDLAALPLHSGQKVTAIVQSSSSEGNVTLNINGKLLQANSSLQLLQGMSLKLTVELENQQILLRLSPEEQQRLIQQQALRQLLPRQDSLKPLLDNLVKLLPQTEKGRSWTPDLASARAAESGAGAGRVPSPTATSMEQVQKLAVQLLRQTATPQSLGETKGLQQAITHSGMFLEQHLAAATTSSFSPDRDVKVLLLRLASLIRQLIASPAGNMPTGKGSSEAQILRQGSIETLLQLQKQTEAGLARIQVNQLSNATASQQGDERPFLIELPVFNPQQQQTELLQLKIQREKNRRGDKSKDCWSITLQMSPEEYGEIQTIVTLTEKKISVTFWCAEADTSELFRDKLQLLTQRMQEQGLEVSRCSAHQGLPANPDTGKANDSFTLIDIKA